MDTRTKGIPRLFDDFQPISDLIQDEDSETLVIDLPGFTKEQLRVQIDRYGALKISGERQTGNNTWRRFRKDFQVPVNCNANELRAKFENGVLNIIMPKKVTEPRNPMPLPQNPTPIPPPPPSPKYTPEPKATKFTEPQNPPLNSPQAPPSPKYIPEPKPMVLPSQIPKPAPILPPNKTQYTTPIPHAETQPPLIQPPEITSSLHAPPSPKHFTEPKQTPTSETTPLSPKLAKKEKPRNVGEQSPKEIEEVKEANAKKVIGNYVRKIKDGSTSSNVTQSGLGQKMDNYKKEIGGLVTEFGKSNELIWNVVVAMLVVVALGIYIGYTLRSPSRT